MRKVEVVVLSEDIRSQNFAVRYAERRGFNPRQIRRLPLLEGKGAADKYVRENYVREVTEHRRHASHRGNVLIVHIDADNHDVGHRADQLKRQLVTAEMAPRGDDERITHLIPRWSIETWVLCLGGEHVDELQSYRDRKVDGDIGSAAIAFFNWSRANFALPERCVPSLAAAIPEVRRLDW